MRLHNAWILDTIVGAADAHVTIRFLHDNAKDGANIDARLAGDGLDAGLGVGDFAVAVVEFHQCGILLP